MVDTEKDLHGDSSSNSDIDNIVDPDAGLSPEEKAKIVGNVPTCLISAAKLTSRDLGAQIALEA